MMVHFRHRTDDFFVATQPSECLLTNHSIEGRVLLLHCIRTIFLLTPLVNVIFDVLSIYNLVDVCPYVLQITQEVVVFVLQL